MPRSPLLAPDALARPPGARIGPLDTFRCLTVTLALVSHALLEFRVDAVTSPALWLTIRSITRSATPGLLLLFGVMAEVVHFRRYEAVGAAMRPRLYRRIAQCYVTFVALAALVMVCRPEPLLYGLRSLAFLTLEGYNVIFALYLFLLIALFGLLPVRRRWGFPGLAAALAGVWVLDALVVSRLPLAAKPLAALGDITLGTGGVWGPSAFHSVSLVIVGMAFGNVLYAARRDRGSRAVAAGIVAVSVLLIGLEMRAVGVGGFFRGIVDLTKYRAHNDPVYYAYGVLGAVAMLPFAYAVDAVAPAPVRAQLHALGGRTFSYFVIGNVLLILIPEYAAPSGGIAALEIALYIGTAAALTLGWGAVERIWRHRRAGEGAVRPPTPMAEVEPQEAASRAGAPTTARPA